MSGAVDGKRSVVVTGASSQIGDALLPLLVADGHEVIAVGRGTPPAGAATTWLTADLSESLQLPRDVDALVHCAPLWLLPERVADFAKAGVARLIAFGSTSVMTKKTSSSPHEQEVVRKLAEAEAAVSEGCKTHGIDWTIFRPTLIYGRGRDANVTTISRFIQRYRFFPLVGNGTGLRQPVHADDLAAACVQALSKPSTYNRAYNLSGGETLTYRQMVTRIFEDLAIKPRYLPLPRLLLRAALRVASVLPPYSHLTPDMADRVCVDLRFDHDDAVRDFRYRPRPFTIRAS